MIRPNFCSPSSRSIQFFFPIIFILVKHLNIQKNQRINSIIELILTCCWISFTTNFTTKRSCPFMNWHFVYSQLLFSIKISLTNFTFEWPKFFMHTLNRNHLRFEFQLPHSALLSSYFYITNNLTSIIWLIVFLSNIYRLLIRFNWSHWIWNLKLNLM